MASHRIFAANRHDEHGSRQDCRQRANAPSGRGTGRPGGGYFDGLSSAKTRANRRSGDSGS
ncbi:MAG: hypothetical protein ACKOGA_10450, partial [Planctomycetaceae bacterium]